MADQSDSFAVSRVALARLLRAFRTSQGRSREEVVSRLKLAESAAAQKQWWPQTKLSVCSNISDLEDSTNLDKTILTIYDLELLADAYGIHRLMIDPLISGEISLARITEPRDWIELAQCKGATSYGTGAHYSYPRYRLGDTEQIAIGKLEIEPHGKSDTHSHPGDELQLLLEGELLVNLVETGLIAPLKKRDYLHFYAEQTHQAVNASNRSAVMLVIRLYQIFGSGSRYRLLHRLAAGVKRLPGFQVRLAQELSQAAMPFLPTDESRSSETTRQIRDRFALARFLELSCAAKYHGGHRITLSQLADRAREKGLTYNRSRFDRLHQGLSVVKASDVRDLAQVYGIDPLLLYDYIAPALRPTIRISNDSWISVPDELVGASSVHYLIPKYRLADSDVAVIRVEFSKQDAATRPVWHPGHELLVPLDGEFEITFGSPPKDRTRIGGEKHVQYLHYPSSLPHAIRCLTPTGRVFAIRFYTE